MSWQMIEVIPGGADTRPAVERMAELLEFRCWDASYALQDFIEQGGTSAEAQVRGLLALSRTAFNTYNAFCRRHKLHFYAEY